MTAYSSHMGRSGSKEEGIRESMCAHACVSMCEPDPEVYLFTAGEG